MANIKISDLPLIANIAPTSGEFPIVYNNVTYKMNWSQLNNQITASGANPLNVTGTGTTSNLTKWTTGGSVIGDSLIEDNGSIVTINGNIKIPNSGTIGSASTSNAIIILSGGEVGIKGTPSYPLHVSGNIIAVEDSAPALRLIGGTTTFDLKSDSGIFIVKDVNGGNELYHIAAGGSGYHKWYINDVQKMILNSSGNLGVKGTPSYPLHVFGNVIAVEDAVPALRLIGSTTSFDLTSDGGIFKIRDVNGGNELYHIAAGGSGYHKWYINDSLKMTLDSSGNVGIGTGTATPGKKLEVRRDDGVSNGLHGITDFNRAGGADAQLLIGYYANGSSVTESTIYSANNLPLSLAAGGSQRLTISSGGVTTLFANIGSAVDNAQLQIKADGSATVTGLMFINAANTNSFNDLAGIVSYIESGNAKGNLQFWTRNSDGNNTDRTTRLTISSGGTVSILSGSNPDLDVKGTVIIRGNSSAHTTHYLTTAAANVAKYDMLDASGNIKNSFSAGGTSYITGGNVLIGTTSDSTGAHKINKNASTNGHILHIGSETTGRWSAFFNASDDSSWNTSNAVMYVGEIGATTRSINAAGTINASGTDYAEYMTKATTDAINKGDVVGINSNGLLTNIFNNAVSFVIKSTNPSYVGGDNWFNGEQKPIKSEEQSQEEFDPILQDFEDRMETERIKVDRIAFSGQVPCNVMGANVGDYIIPISSTDGKITGQAVSNPTFDQYKLSVGKVWKIMEDGRSWVAVKIG